MNNTKDSDREYEKFIRPMDVATELGVTVGAVYRWIRLGKLRSIQPTGQKGAVLIYRESYDEFLKPDEKVES